MGASAGKSESESESGAEFSQDVWGPQGGALQDLYSNVSNLFGDTVAGGMNRVIQEIPRNMQAVEEFTRPALAHQMWGGAYRDMQLDKSLSDQLERSLGSPSATQEINAMIMGGEGNNYADAMREQYLQDATQAQENMLRNLDQRVASSNLPGGSRHGVATALGMQDINKNLQSEMARTGYETFDKDLDRKLQIAQQADQGTLAREQMMQQMLGANQAARQNAIASAQGVQQLGTNQFAPYMMPWQAAGQYANIIGRPTILGSGQMSGSSDSKGTSLGFGV